MDDAEFLFWQDVKDKKRTAAGAYRQIFHGAGGRHNLGLRQEHMTEREWKKMNGEVITYNLGTPMSWKDFKKMNDDMKKQYILSLKKKFNARTTQIAEMLGVSTHTVQVERIRLGIADTRGGGHMTWKDLETWSHFVNPAETAAEAPTPVITEMPKPVEAPIPVITEMPKPVETPIVTPKTISDNVNIVFDESGFEYTGKYDSDMLSHLFRVLADRDDVTLEVNATVVRRESTALSRAMMSLSEAK